MGLLNLGDVGGLEGPFQNDLPFHSFGFVEVNLAGGGRKVGRRPISALGPGACICCESTQLGTLLVVNTR